MFDPITLLRRAEYKALSTLTFNGEAVDLGGSKDAPYLACIKGDFKVLTVNIDPKTKPDLFHDLEKPVPLESSRFNHAILMNVVEHIFRYRELLRETFRLLKPGGSVVVVIPFLFPVHPSPRDFRRLTDDALRSELEEVGFTNIKVVPLGTGVFASSFLAFDRLLPKPIRYITYVLGYGAHFCDYVFAVLGRAVGKKYRQADYALGYFVRAYKK